MTPAEFAARLQAKGSGPTWAARCPSHDDTNASLSIGTGEDGRVLVHCHAGCPLEAVLQAMGLQERDLYPEGNGGGNRRRIVAEYNYIDEEVKLLYQVVRYEPKDFRQRRPGEGRRWIWSMKGVRKIPYCLNQILGREEVLIVEGEKDVDNLWRAGLAATCNPGGARKWRGEYSTTLKAAGVRRVPIIPDDDETGRDHAAEVARSCMKEKLEVRIVELPPLPAGEGSPRPKDVSDWLAAGGTKEALCDAMKAAPILKDPPPAPERAGGSQRGKGAEEEEEKPPLDPAYIAKEALGAEHFARDPGLELYHYQKGVYRPAADIYIRRRVKSWFEMMMVSPDWQSKRPEEVIKWLEADAPFLWDAPPLETINLRNGLLDWKAGKLLPHDHQHLSPVQLPVEYLPGARCPRWEKFVDEVFPDDATDLAWEIIAWLAIPYLGIQKAALLLGEGGNGKSAYLRGVTAFLGRENCAAVSLQKLETDRFAAAALVGRLGNIVPDLPSQHLEGTSTFKAITGGDMIHVERKFQRGFEVRPFARLIFSANRPPRTSDPSSAFFQRWIVLRFERVFRGTKAEIPSAVLDAELAHPGELSGVLNKALTALPGILSRGFSETDSMKRAATAFRAITDPVEIWLDTHVIRHPAATVPKQELRGAYNRAAASEGRPPETDHTFNAALKRWKPDVAEGQRTWAGRPRVHCWLGIGLRGDPQPDMPGNGEGEKEGDGNGYGTPVIPATPVKTEPSPRCPNCGRPLFAGPGGNNLPCAACAAERKA